MSFTAPTLDEVPVVLDFNTMDGLRPFRPRREDVGQLAPGLVLHSIGLGVIGNAWAGLLAGASFDKSRNETEWPSGRSQGGASMMAFKVSLFTEPERFGREMDEYARRTERLRPLAGFEANMPGGPEAASEERYQDEGVPIGPEHQQELEELAAELRMDPPW